MIRLSPINDRYHTLERISETFIWGYGGKCCNMLIYKEVRWCMCNQAAILFYLRFTQ